MHQCGHPGIRPWILLTGHHQRWRTDELQLIRKITGTENLIRLKIASLAPYLAHKSHALFDKIRVSLPKTRREPSLQSRLYVRVVIARPQVFKAARHFFFFFSRSPRYRTHYGKALNFVGMINRKTLRYQAAERKPREMDTR